MASIETDRALIEEGLRVAQLLPSIVIGDSRTGNNRGDTKVVNAPINAFGRAKEAIGAAGRRPRRAARRPRADRRCWPPASRATPRAELNLVPVDRVVAGILAALSAPEAIGNRIHLATDNRIRSEDMMRITREELGVNVRLADPTLYRNLTLPVVKAVLARAGRAEARERRSRSWAPSSAATASGASPSTTWATTCASWACPSAGPTPSTPSACCAGTTSTCRSSGGCATCDEIARRERLWERGARRAIEREHRATRRRRCPPAEFRRAARRGSSCGPSARDAPVRSDAASRPRESTCVTADDRSDEGRSVFDRLKERGEEVFTQVSNELMQNRALHEGHAGRRCAGKQKLDEAAGRALKTMNIPTRTEFKRARRAIEALERELVQSAARAPEGVRGEGRQERRRARRSSRRRGQRPRGPK